jgi:CO dehydrogenase maturation factor
MKLAITGKGGVGKTTITGLLAHRFQEDGYRVLAVDADPDANLASALGIPSEQSAAIVPISQQTDLIRSRTGAVPGRFGQMFKLNPEVKDIPEKFLYDHGGIKLLVLGAVQKGGGGCACPENVFLQSLLSEVFLNRDEVLLVDMEAGIEHLGRAVTRTVDRMLIVVEPGSRSVATAGTILKLAREIGVVSFGIIGNKVRNDEQKEWIVSQFPSDPYLGTVSYSEAVHDADIKQEALLDRMDDTLRHEIQAIYAGLSEGPAAPE